MGKGKAAAETVILPEDCEMESWSDAHSKIDVAEESVAGGVRYNLAVHSKVDATTDRVFEILSDPASEKIFRSIKACTERKVLEENGPLRKLQVTHRAVCKFLWITVNFDTSLFVWEDAKDKTIRFQMAKAGFMRTFDGMWTIRPFDQQSLQELADARTGNKAAPVSRQTQQQQPHSWFNPGNLFKSITQHSAPSPSASLVTLQQALVPAVPPGVRHIVRSMCLKQIRDMMEDLQDEVNRRHDSDIAKIAVGASSQGRQRQVAPPAAVITPLRAGAMWAHVTPLVVTVKL